jgi:hypothetical protein
VVGGEASGTSLADVQLPAAEIGGGWFHGFGFLLVKGLDWFSILVRSTKWSGY